MKYEAINHEIKWINDKIYIMSSVGIPFATRACDVGLFTNLIEKEDLK